MSIDLTEVLQLFIEESTENLDVMESSLLDLEVGNLDRELLNSIFRAAHSIKGGAGIFKFDHIIHFAHTAEALLDEIRNEEHIVTQAVIELLLEAVDVLRLMIKSLQEGDEPPEAEMVKCQIALEQMLKAPLGQAFLEVSDYEHASDTADTALEEPPRSETSDVSVATEEESIHAYRNALLLEGGASTHPPAPAHQSESAALDTILPEISTVGWQIHFTPLPHLLKTGNDPINLFRELGQLGELTVTPNIDRLPDFNVIDPHLCYLDWVLTLRGEVARAEIIELFEWVADDCVLELVPLETLPDSLISAAETPLPATTTTESTQTASNIEVNADYPVTAQATAQIPEPVAITPAPPVAQQPTAMTAAEPIEPVSTLDTVEASESKTPAVSAKPATQLANNKAAQMTSPKPEKMSGNEANSIRVGIDKIDDLINIVGELVITQSMLDEVSDDNIDDAKRDQLRTGLAQLKRNTRELQESVMRIRMLPISVSFNRFPRLVHDLSKQLDKKVELKLSGEHTELDKTVLEKMSDPLVHLVRNALDHGIESPAVRLAAGKPETGILHLHAFHQGGNIIIQISDDGAGFNLAKIRQKAIERKLLEPDEAVTEEQLHEFIFHPGFSTTEQVNDLSGRGVGMDVVRKNIRALGGNIEVKSVQYHGTIFDIRLPLTLAILDGQLVRVGKEIYIISLLSIVESLRAVPRYISSLAGQAEVYKLRDEYIPIMRLYELFHVKPDLTELTEGLLVIVEGEGQKIGLFVDELLSQQQIVIKSLDTNYKRVQGISGATILGDGSVALILDIVGLIQYFHAHYHKPQTLNKYAGAA